MHSLSMMAKAIYRQAVMILAELKANWQFETDNRLSAAKFPLAVLSEKQAQLIYLYQIYILRDYFHFIIKPNYFLVWIIFVTRQACRPTQFYDDANKKKRNNGPP